jgi:hypothetical protein
MEITKVKNRVLYKGKIYEVLENNFQGHNYLYKLGSRFEKTTSFPAVKTECAPIYYSEELGKFVTIVDAIIDK